MTDRESIADLIRGTHHRRMATGLFNVYVSRATPGFRYMAERLWDREGRRYQQTIREGRVLRNKLEREIRTLKRRIAGDA